MHQYDEPETNASLRLSITETSISVAARLKVHIEVEWELGADVVLDVPDWSSEGWEVVEQIRLPVESVSADHPEQLGQSTDVVLEPFLPGEYRVPEIRVHVRDANGVERSIESEAIPVQVVSAMSTDDADELSPPSGEYVLPEPVQSDHMVLWGMLVVICLVAMVLLLRLYALRNRSLKESRISPFDLLQEVAHSETMVSDEGFEKVYAALTSLYPELQQTSEIRGMIEQCESARFAPNPEVYSTPGFLARQALEILGESEDAR
ncbi:MAG: hypothetical protein ACWA5W_10940 [Phycisphaerales bacterium]